MQYRYMGKTGLQLSVLSLGSWITFHKQFNQTMADELMSIAYEHGVNFFDNAEVYALGESERIMGKVLAEKKWERSSFVVSSKVYFGWRGKENKPNQTGLSRKHIIEGCNEALQRLQVDYLDLYFCHRPDKQAPIEEVVVTMNYLMQQGKILYWGTSEWSAQEIMEAHAVAKSYGLQGPVMEQPEYNMLSRQKMECDFLQIFKNYGLGTTIWSPLASGLLTGKYAGGLPADSRLALPGFEWLKDKYFTQANIDKVNQLQAVANELETDLTHLSLAWCVANPNVTTVIIGASKREQLLHNLACLPVVEKITPAIMGKIDNIMGSKPIQPPY
jgi:voltage-dependent potassium channel beta subunit